MNKASFHSIPLNCPTRSRNHINESFFGNCYLIASLLAHVSMRLIVREFVRYRHTGIFIGAGTLVAYMESSEIPEDESEPGLTEEDHKYLRRREAFAEKDAKKYGSKEEARAVFDHWA